MYLTRNRVQWVFIKSDFDGGMAVSISRESQQDDVESTPWYLPTSASKQRVLRLAERLVVKYRVSFEFGELTGKLKMLIHMSLPPKS